MLSYQKAEAPGINDPGTETFGGSLAINWAARDNTDVSFAASRSQRLSTQDYTVVSNGVRLSVEQKLRYNLTGRATLGRNWEDFRAINREETRTYFLADFHYTFAVKWEASFAYRFDTVESQSGGADWDRHQVTVSAGYTF